MNRRRTARSAAPKFDLHLPMDAHSEVQVQNKKTDELTTFIIDGNIALESPMITTGTHTSASGRIGAFTTNPPISLASPPPPPPFSFASVAASGTVSLSAGGAGAGSAAAAVVPHTLAGPATATVLTNTITNTSTVHSTSNHNNHNNNNSMITHQHVNPNSGPPSLGGISRGNSAVVISNGPGSPTGSAAIFLGGGAREYIGWKKAQGGATSSATTIPIANSHHSHIHGCIGASSSSSGAPPNPLGCSPAPPAPNAQFFHVDNTNLFVLIDGISMFYDGASTYKGFIEPTLLKRMGEKERLRRKRQHLLSNRGPGDAEVDSVDMAIRDLEGVVSPSGMREGMLDGPPHLADLATPLSSPSPPTGGSGSHNSAQAAIPKPTASALPDAFKEVFAGATPPAKIPAFRWGVGVGHPRKVVTTTGTAATGGVTPAAPTHAASSSGAAAHAGPAAAGVRCAAPIFSQPDTNAAMEMSNSTLSVFSLPSPAMAGSASPPASGTSARAGPSYPPPMRPPLPSSASSSPTSPQLNAASSSTCATPVSSSRRSRHYHHVQSSSVGGGKKKKDSISIEAIGQQNDNVELEEVTFRHTIGAGSQGTVIMVELNRKFYAMKKMDVNAVLSASNAAERHGRKHGLIKELEMIKKQNENEDPKNIIRMFNAVMKRQEDGQHLYLLMELMWMDLDRVGEMMSRLTFPDTFKVAQMTFKEYLQGDNRAQEEVERLQKDLKGSCKHVSGRMKFGEPEAWENKIEERKTPFPEIILSMMAADVLLGLKELHEDYHIVHCDLKPGNILMSYDKEHFKIADFGCGRSLDAETKRTKGTGEDFGTKLYKAPERFHTSAEIGGTLSDTGSTEERTDFGPKADVWSLGIILLELSAGIHPCHPFKSEYWTYASNLRLAKMVKPLKWSAGLFDFILRCTFVSEEQRWSVNQLMKHPFVARYRNVPRKRLASFMVRLEEDSATIHKRQQCQWLEEQIRISAQGNKVNYKRQSHAAWREFTSFLPRVAPSLNDRNVYPELR